MRADVIVLFQPIDLADIDGDRALDGDTEIGAAARHVGGAGAGHQSLGRNAADVHASAAEQLPLDDRASHALAGHPRGK